MRDLPPAIRTGVEVKVYPPFDCFGRIVYGVGLLTGRMLPGLCHVTVVMYNEGVASEYHLTIDGIQKLPQHLNSPSLSFWFPASKYTLLNVYLRMEEYDMHGFRVTVSSLVNTLLFPNKPNPALCTSFAEFLLKGKVTSASNDLNKFIMELQWLTQLSLK